MANNPYLEGRRENREERNIAQRGRRAGSDGGKGGGQSRGQPSGLGGGRGSSASPDTKPNTKPVDKNRDGMNDSQAADNPAAAYRQYLEQQFGVNFNVQSDYNDWLLNDAYTQFQNEYEQANLSRGPKNTPSFVEYVQDQMKGGGWRTLQDRYQDYWSNNNQDQYMGNAWSGKGIDPMNTANSRLASYYQQRGEMAQEDYARQLQTNPNLSFRDFVDRYNTSNFNNDYLSLSPEDRGVVMPQPSRWVAY